MSFRHGLPSGEDLSKHMDAFTIWQSTLHSSQGKPRAVEEDHSAVKFFQSRAPVKVPSASIFAPLTASKGASASNPAPPEEQVEDEETKAFEGGQMQLNDAIAENLQV